MEVNLNVDTLRADVKKKSDISGSYDSGQNFDQSYKHAKARSTESNASQHGGKNDPSKGQKGAVSEQSQSSNNQNTVKHNSTSAQDTNNNNREQVTDNTNEAEHHIVVKSMDEQTNQEELDTEHGLFLLMMDSKNTNIEINNGKVNVEIDITKQRIQDALRNQVLTPQNSTDMATKNKNQANVSLHAVPVSKLIADAKLKPQVQVNVDVSAKAQIDDFDINLDEIDVETYTKLSQNIASKSITADPDADIDPKALQLTQLRSDFTKTDASKNIDIIVNKELSTDSLNQNQNQNGQAQLNFANTKQPAQETKANPLKLDSGKVDNFAIHTKEVSDALIKKMEIFVKNNNQSAKIVLDPPELGHLEVRITQQGDRTHVAFTASSQVAKDVLELNMERLRDLLVEQDLNSGQLDVGLSQQQHSDKGHHGGGSQSHALHHDAGNSEDSQEPVRIIAGNNSALDVFI